MPRAARIVIPGIPHHITQRGNRRQRVFFSDDDKALYLRLFSKWAEKSGLIVWAYCLMDNHVHHVAVPFKEASLAEALGQTHKAYTKVINEREGWRGFLWQGRFSSYPMDDPYLYRAMRYDELNPVRAKIVENAIEYSWSSARAHVLGEANPLLARPPLGMNGQEWAIYLREGLIESETRLFRDHSGSTTPLGDEDFFRRIGVI
ncbi:MAG: transposase [Candidatus Aminicenantes bacterium]|nr:transposase [Candidatus Aminicenantes bacterium]